MTRHALLFTAALLLVPALGFAEPPFDDNPADCPPGQVFDFETRTCTLRTSGAIGDADRLKYGTYLARKGKYDRAIRVLTDIIDRDNPDMMTMMGFAHRKSGRIEIAFGYYREALKRDPDNLLAREYYGEAHLMAGDVAAAREQLAEIKARCGTDCEAYRDLAGAIEAHSRQ